MSEVRRWAAWGVALALGVGLVVWTMGPATAPLPGVPEAPGKTRPAAVNGLPGLPDAPPSHAEGAAAAPAAPRNVMESRDALKARFTPRKALHVPWVASELSAEPIHLRDVAKRRLSNALPDLQATVDQLATQHGWDAGTRAAVDEILAVHAREVGQLQAQFNTGAIDEKDVVTELYAAQQATGEQIAGALGDGKGGDSLAKALGATPAPPDDDAGWPGEPMEGWTEPSASP